MISCYSYPVLKGRNKLLFEVTASLQHGNFTNFRQKKERQVKTCLSKVLFSYILMLF